MLMCWMLENWGGLLVLSIWGCAVGAAAAAAAVPLFLLSFSACADCVRFLCSFGLGKRKKKIKEEEKEKGEKER